MKQEKFHYIVDWCIIIAFLIIIWASWIDHDMYVKVTPIAPVCIFVLLSLLFLNHISIKICVVSKDIEFFFLCGGIFWGCVNMILVRSRIGAIFTLSDFLLILYLANKIQFDKLQLGALAISSFFMWFYWQFIDKSVYGNTIFNPNSVSLFIFTNFCVFICYFVFLASSLTYLPKYFYHLIIFIFLFLITKRLFLLNSRGALVAIASWMFTYYFLPKKKYTIPLILGTSLLIPIIYVAVWKIGATDGVIIFGKRLSSGRDIIWYEFSKAFLQHPITGIGSDFERMVPDLYLKEIHHSLLNFLFVHGIPVFIIILYLFYKRISDVITTPYNPVMAVCLASIYGMLASGTFENYYIVPGYNILLLVIFFISNAFVQNQKNYIKQKIQERDNPILM